jgi:hypothetical protein
MARATNAPKNILVIRSGTVVGYCRRKRAESRVHSHRAVWRAEDAIEMVSEDARDKAEMHRLQGFTAAVGYDLASSSGMLTTRKETEHIPITCIAVALNMGYRSPGCGPRRRY